MNRIKGHKSVDGYIITNKNYEIIRTTYKGDKKVEGEKIMANIPDLVVATQKAIKNINPVVA